MNRILLADPNPTLRSALALLLETRLNAQIVGQVSCFESLLCEAVATQPDIIIVDLGLPGQPIRERMAALRQKAPNTSVLIVCACLEKTNLPEGIGPFLCHTDPPETILANIQALIQPAGQKEEHHV